MIKPKRKKILYITTELAPYFPDNYIAKTVYATAKKMYGRSSDIRVFMPKYGAINERRYQLHEVIRLSGMNVSIDSFDQPLIIKVASLPNERLQVYFVDNEEYFGHKNFYFEDDGTPLPNNDEKAIFFARGVVESIKKLNWVPDYIHLHGWMTSLFPLYLKHAYKDDSYFNDAKTILSLYCEENGKLSPNMAKKLAKDGVVADFISEDMYFHDFVHHAIDNVDVVQKGEEFLSEDFEQKLKETKTKVVGFLTVDQVESLYDTKNNS